MDEAVTLLYEKAPPRTCACAKGELPSASARTQCTALPAATRAPPSP